MLIQQAIAQVLTPIYEKQFSDSSYGFRPNRDCHMAIKKSLEYINDGYKYVVDMDLEKFFDKVNHDKLMQILNKCDAAERIIQRSRNHIAPQWKS